GPGPRIDGNRIFAGLDANSDGNLSKSEADVPLGVIFIKNFGEADSDQDGFVSKNEFKKGSANLEFPDPPSPRFGGKAEAGQGAPIEGPRLPPNTPPGSMIGPKGAGTGLAGPNPLPPKFEYPPGLLAETLFKAQDKDGDGFLSKKEAKGPLAKQFYKLDIDKDGKLSLVEVRSGLELPGLGAPAVGDKGKKFP
ncbi:MAG TPA: hypothetical protein VNC50_20850, partial [Planctomycetia bacterium]|nr:hypothetical protein [Planctomycetia bacterium]